MRDSVCVSVHECEIICVYVRACVCMSERECLCESACVCSVPSCVHGNVRGHWEVAFLLPPSGCCGLSSGWQA